MQVNLQAKLSWVINKSQKCRHMTFNLFCFAPQCIHLSVTVIYLMFGVFFILLIIFWSFYLFIFLAPLPSDLDPYARLMVLNKKQQRYTCCCSNGRNRKHLHEIAPERFTQLDKESTWKLYAEMKSAHLQEENNFFLNRLSSFSNPLSSCLTSIRLFSVAEIFFNSRGPPP